MIADSLAVWLGAQNKSNPGETNWIRGGPCGLLDDDHDDGRAGLSGSEISLHHLIQRELHGLVAAEPDRSRRALGEKRDKCYQYRDSVSSDHAGEVDDADETGDGGRSGVDCSVDLDIAAAGTGQDQTGDEE